MERRRNYFMPNNGQIGFSPLHMFGLKTINPKSMQHGFVDVNVNTHIMDDSFSLFKSKDHDTEIANMSNLMNPFGSGLPVGNSFSKLIGGFIGSKCLIGSSAGRGNNFWGRVLQQYNSIIGTNSNLYISMPAMNTKENTGEYIKADAALLISQSFDVFSSSIIPQKQTMEHIKKISPEELPQSFSEMPVQEITTEPKQSYAEVTKSAGVNKSPCSPAFDKCSMNRRKEGPVRRKPAKLHQKRQHSDRSSNNWRYSGDIDILGKRCVDSTGYKRETHRPHGISTHDNQPKSVTASYSRKGTLHMMGDQKLNRMKTKSVQHSASSRRPSGKRRLNSNLLSDIKEDCLSMDNDVMVCQKKVTNDQFTHSRNGSSVTPEQRSVSNPCRNWRCRPYSLCEPCKVKDYYHNDVPECYMSHTRDKAITCELEGKKNNKESSDSEMPVIPLSEVKPESFPSKQTSCSDSPLTESEIYIATAYPVMRTRMLSECSVDSDDSFIIMFDANGDDIYEETNSSETASVCSDTDSNSSEDESSLSSQCFIYEESSDDDDEPNFDDDTKIGGLSWVSEYELKEANARWKNAYEHILSAEKEPAKVHFAKSPEFETVHKIIAWDFAYRAARLGPWELIARDRIRFRRRIEHVSRVLGPILQDHHRRQLWQKFHKEALDVH